MMNSSIGSIEYYLLGLKTLESPEQPGKKRVIWIAAVFQTILH